MTFPTASQLTLKLMPELDLATCPHCRSSRPRLTMAGQFDSKDFSKSVARWWKVYVCSHCGGAVTAASYDGQEGVVAECFPTPTDPSGAIPDPARTYLSQAQNSLHAPAGAVLLCASAVDAMLKTKGYVKGNLYSRIDDARRAHLITEDMAKWAHEVRLDANDQRHADNTEPLPTQEDAQRSIGFTTILAEILFVIPQQVTRGLVAASASVSASPSASAEDEKA